MKYNRLGIFSFSILSLSPQTIPMRKVFIYIPSKKRRKGRMGEKEKD
jgi:hypothetical protein